MFLFCSFSNLNYSVNDDEDVLQLLTGDDDYDAEIDEDVEEELLRDEFEESNISVSYTHLTLPTILRV